MANAVASAASRNPAGFAYAGGMLSTAVALTLAVVRNAAPCPDVPKYLRGMIVLRAMADLGSAFPHWFLLPAGGLERVAGMDLGPPSTARGMAIGLQAADGQHKFFVSIM